jgi:hypothetical protein
MAVQKINGNQISNTTDATIAQLQFANSNSSLKLPTGTTAQRPTGISRGTIRFNATTDVPEIYNSQTGVNDWNGIGSETGVDGGGVFVRTNGPTITKDITIGPTANNDQKYTWGILIGDITINTGNSVTVEDGAGLFIIDEADDGLIIGPSSSAAGASYLDGGILYQSSYANAIKLTTSASPNATVDSFTFTKSSSTSRIIVQGAVSCRGNTNDGNYYFLDINGTRNYTGWGESPYSEYNGLYCTQVWTTLSAGNYTASWGWSSVTGTSERPFDIMNINNGEDGRNRQNGSEWYVWEVDAGTDLTTPSEVVATTSTDIYYNAVSLLLSFNGDVVDKSQYIHTVTSGGNFGFTSSPSSPLSGGAQVANFVASSGYTRLSVPDHQALRLETSDFTIEGWIYINSVDSGLSGYNRRVFQKGANSSTGYGLFYSSSDFYFGRTDEAILTTTRSSWNGNWYHFAIVREGNIFRMYRNGVQVSSSVSNASTNLNNTDPLYFGVYPADITAAASNHYLEDFRITKGVCRYPSGVTFIPSTNPFASAPVNTLGTVNTNPATSATAILTVNPTAQSGLYWIKPTGYSGSAFQVYCDMETSGGGWMHCGTISDNNEASNNATNHPWSSPLNATQNTGIWQDTSTLGTQSFTSDFKGLAWSNCPFTQFLIKDQGNSLRNLFYTQSGQITSNNTSFSSFWTSLSWAAVGSDSSNSAYSAGRARGVTINHFNISDDVLDASGKSIILLKYGEADGTQDANKDRTMIAWHRHNQPDGVDAPAGLGCFTNRGGTIDYRDVVPSAQRSGDFPAASISGAPFNYTIWIK